MFILNNILVSQIKTLKFATPFIAKSMKNSS